MARALAPRGLQRVTSRAGAELNAECVVSGLKALPHDPVAAYFSAKGKAVASYVE